jgi:hypothetical protein
MWKLNRENTNAQMAAAQPETSLRILPGGVPDLRHGLAQGSASPESACGAGYENTILAQDHCEADVSWEHQPYDEA